MLDWLSKLVVELIAARFYGRVTLCFEHGKLTQVKKEESLKPPP